MTHEAPTFLLALGLDGDADERSVRKAYAQRLKRIDQAAEPQAFQALRENYELALWWVQTAREVASATAPAPPPPPPAAPVPTQGAADDAHTQAAAVFAAFADRQGRGVHNEHEARSALDAALDDPRLLALEAAHGFECLLAGALLEGWQPGHEFMLGPAAERFGWDRDRRRLNALGPPTQALDEALSQRRMVLQWPHEMLARYRELMPRLRGGAEPDAHALGDAGPMLRLVADCAPDWLRIVTPQPRVDHWLQAFDALPERDRLSAQARWMHFRHLAEEADAAPDRFRIGPWQVLWLSVVLVLALPGLLSAVFGR